MGHPEIDSSEAHRGDLREQRVDPFTVSGLGREDIGCNFGDTTEVHRASLAVTSLPAEKVGGHEAETRRLLWADHGAVIDHR